MTFSWKYLGSRPMNLIINWSSSVGLVSPGEISAANFYMSSKYTTTLSPGNRVRRLNAPVPYSFLSVRWLKKLISSFVNSVYFTFSFRSVSFKASFKILSFKLLHVAHISSSNPNRSEANNNIYGSCFYSDLLLFAYLSRDLRFALDSYLHVQDRHYKCSLLCSDFLELDIRLCMLRDCYSISRYTAWLVILLL